MEPNRSPDWPPIELIPDPLGVAETQSRLLYEDAIVAGLPNDSLKDVARNCGIAARSTPA